MATLVVLIELMKMRESCLSLIHPTSIMKMMDQSINILLKVFREMGHTLNSWRQLDHLVLGQLNIIMKKDYQKKKTNMKMNE
jgi:hypothetical protein